MKTYRLTDTTFKEIDFDDLFPVFSFCVVTDHSAFTGDIRETTQALADGQVMNNLSSIHDYNIYYVHVPCMSLIFCCTQGGIIQEYIHVVDPTIFSAQEKQIVAVQDSKSDVLFILLLVHIFTGLLVFTVFLKRKPDETN